MKIKIVVSRECNIPELLTLKLKKAVNSFFLTFIDGLQCLRFSVEMARKDRIVAGKRIDAVGEEAKKTIIILVSLSLYPNSSSTFILHKNLIAVRKQRKAGNFRLPI